jgi:3'(2'), 5'-bisphosphate nucleotidase
MESIKNHLPSVIAIAEKAGAAIREIFTSRHFTTDEKEDQTPVTSADVLANALILEGIEALNSGYPIVSEEASPKIQQKEPLTYWSIDPLDGTKEFIQNREDFTVNIALVHQGYPVLGVVHLPIQNITYSALHRKGANRHDQGKILALVCKPFGFADPGLVVVCSRNHLDERTRKFMDVLNHPLVLPHGSASKITEVAEGKAHLYPRFSPTHIWDTAAAQIIVEEAGGKVMDMTTGKRLHYTHCRQKNNGILVTGRVQIPEAVWQRFHQ